MKKIAVLFHRLGPYHHARIRAAGRLGQVVAVEFSAVDETYAWNRIEGDDSFHKVTIFRDTDIDTRPPSVVLERVGSVLDQIRPNVVAIPGWSSTGSLAALFWCGKTGTPAIVMSESTVHDAPRRWWREEVKSRLVQSFATGLVGGMPHVAYLSVLGLPRERIFSGYDVVDNAHFIAGAEAARRDALGLRKRLGLPDHYFLASNRFIEKKNLFRLLRAYAAYRQRPGSNAWHLVVLGDGPLKSRLVEFAEELDISAYVLFPGFKQYDDLPCYYGLACAFVHASTTEQWGLVVNEAMASGLPVIVSMRCGCAQDLVEEGRNGFTFNPYEVDPLVELMLSISSDDCDREAMAQASRAIIGRWSPETFAENLWKAAEAALQYPPRMTGPMDRALLWTLCHR